MKEPIVIDFTGCRPMIHWTPKDALHSWREIVEQSVKEGRFLQLRNLAWK